MNTELEEAVRRALDAGGTIAPDLDADLAIRARSRYLRRRRVARGLSGTAAVATTIVLMIGGTAVVRDRVARPLPTAPATSGVNGGPDQYAAGVAQTVPLLRKNMPTVEQMWPDAILSLPLQLPNYQDYQVIAQYKPGVYVVQTGNGTVYRYKPATGDLVVLIEPPVGVAPSRADTAWVVNGEYAVLDNGALAGHAFSIWVVDVGSGQQVVQVSVPAGQAKPYSYAWLDGALLWTPTASNGGGARGIYSSRDPSNPMPGTAEYTLTGAGTWATSVTRADPTEMRWWNLATGWQNTVRAPVNSWSVDYPCAGSYCLDYGIDSAYVANGDAVQYQAITGFEDVTPKGDHFALLTPAVTGLGRTTAPGGSPVPPAQQVTLWDLASRKTALVDMATANPLLHDPGHDILPLANANGQKRVLVLTALG